MSVSNETLRRWGQLSVHAVITSFFKPPCNQPHFTECPDSAFSRDVSEEHIRAYRQVYYREDSPKVERPLFIIKERYNITGG